MNKYKRKLTKRNKNHYKPEQFKHLKSEIQREQCQAYCVYTESMIFYIKTPDQGKIQTAKLSKKLFSYKKAHKQKQQASHYFGKTALLNQTHQQNPIF